MTGKYTTDNLPRLPKLPLPQLDDTLSQLKQALKPLVGTAEYAKFQSILEEFAVEDGPTLQDYLTQTWQETNASWLAPLWQHHYLANRAPLQTSSNFALTLSPTSLPDLPPVELVGKLLQSFADQYLSFVSEQTNIDQSIDGSPLDMSQYAHLFRTQRQAHLHQDTIQRTRLAKIDVEATIVFKQTVFQITLIDHKGRVATLHSLTEAIRQIVATKSLDSLFIGSFTGTNRNIAARIRHQLRQNPKNRVNLDRISDSLLVLTLPDREESASLQRTLVGPNEHFFDKTIQVNCDYENGISIAFEHSDIDGIPALNLVQSVIGGLATPTDQWDDKGSPHFSQLIWQLDDVTKENLIAANHFNQQTADQLNFAAATIQTFGRRALKSLNVSPDAFFQIVLALTSYRTTGSWQSIYEPVSKRQFYGGRTENVRTVSDSVKQFILSFENKSDEATIKAHFETAIQQHQENIDRARQGLGVERHLLGLHDMMIHHGGSAAFPIAEAFFRSPSLIRLASDYFSTTSLPYDFIDDFSFAPTSATGFGLYYGMLEDELRLTVSAWQDSSFTAQEIADLVISTAQEVFDWLKTSGN